ncbi:TonB-dependent receptor plug domain-containing protein [Pseudoxanthomonas mexicana]
MSLMSRATPRASCLSVAVAAALSLALSAHAAEPVVLPDGVRATELDTVEVKGRKAGLEQAAGTGTRLSLSLLQTPASVTVIDRDTLDARGVRTTQEALAGIPGLTVASPPGNGNAVTYRGFSGSQITQLFNGIHVQYASIAARPVDAWQYERVEAIGGPSSFLYGAGAVGGTINYVTRLARLDRDEAGMRASWGSFRDGTLAMGANVRVGGDDARQAIRVDASSRDAESGIDGQEREASTLAASWLVQVAPCCATRWRSSSSRRTVIVPTGARLCASRRPVACRCCRRRWVATTTSPTATTDRTCAGYAHCWSGRRASTTPCATRSTTTTRCAITATSRAIA